MKFVTQAFPDAHLLLVGATGDLEYAQHVRHLIRAENLEGHVSLLGARQDVERILRSCDVGVLSSASEGLPLSLLEYGMAGLAAVATRIGQCPEVLEEGASGLLVPPGDPQQLAAAILSLLRSPDRRAELACRFQIRVAQAYSAGAAMDRICKIYQGLLERSR
jgi:glycosyltransferase involved in cell wall biosynthesis